MNQNHYINSNNNQSHIKVGSLLHGTYRIESELSKGGFSKVYLASHVHLRAWYAIKEINPDFFKSREKEKPNTHNTAITPFTTVPINSSIERLVYGARCLQLVNNRHVVKFYDLFEENDAYYFVMEYINGKNLKEKLENLENYKINEEEVNLILRQLLIALKEIHGYNILHLDIKPANIVQTPKGTIKLIDFGSCCQTPTKGSITRSVSLISTYTEGYSPIEQIESQEDKIGPWTDFYSLGATLYNLLTGKLPPKTSDLIDDTNKNVFLDLNSVTPRMRDLIQWLMQPNWRFRPKNVMEIMDFLKEREVLRKESVQDSYECWFVPLPSDFILVSPSCRYRIIGTFTTDSDIDTIIYIAQAIADKADNEGTYYLIGERFDCLLSRRCGNGMVFNICSRDAITEPLAFHINAKKITGIKEIKGVITKKGRIQAERFYVNGTFYFAVHVKIDL